MITGNLYKPYFSLAAKIIIILIVLSCIVFLYYIITIGTCLVTKISFGSALFLMFFGYFFVRNIKLIGLVTFNEEQLRIKLEGKDFIYPMSDIENLEIFYFGYKFQNESSIYTPLLFHDGTDNEVRFYYNRKLYIYKFQITEDEFLTKLIMLWKNVRTPKIRIYQRDKRSKVIWMNIK